MRATTQKTCAMVLGIVLSICIHISLEAYAAVPDVVLKQKRAVVTIYINDKEGNEIATGSGFIVTSNGIIATNYHVISKLLEENSRSSIIKMENGAYYPVKKIVSFDEDNDIALIQVEGKELATLKLAKNYIPKQGDSITVIGSPFGLETTVSDGIISSMRGQGGLIQITAPISPGSSGSPVFNSKGEVIGIATFLIQGGQNINFAIPIKRVVNLINKPKKQRSPVDLLRSVEKPVESPPPIPDSDVRVQDNGWLRIMDYFVEEKRMGELNKDFEKIPGLKDEITKKLYIKVQFLKRCKAKLLSDKIKDTASNAESDKYIDIGIYIAGYAELSKAGKKKEMEEYRAKVLARYPDLDKILEEYYLFPKFNCDYRTKVFVTFYNSKKIEVETDQQIPISYWQDNGERKIEMLPGETIYVTFIVPGSAKAWDIWLPK